MINVVDSLLPGALLDSSAETRRQAVLVVYAVALSTLAMFLTLALLFGLGHTVSAMSLVWILPLQIVPLLVLFVSHKPRLAARALVILLLFEIAIDFGPDDGFSAVATVALPVAALALLSMAGGICRTVVAVLWAGYLGPFVSRVQDYSSSISLSMAIVTLAAGAAHHFNNLLTVINGIAELLPASEPRNNIQRAGATAWAPGTAAAEHDAYNALN